MLNTFDNLPEDPAELRQFTELLATEVKAQALMIEKLQHQLHGANLHRFGSKSEGMEQLQLFAENEEISKASVEVVETTPAEPVEPKENPSANLCPIIWIVSSGSCLLVRIAPNVEVTYQNWERMLPKNWNTSRAALW